MSTKKTKEATAYCLWVGSRAELWYTLEELNAATKQLYGYTYSILYTNFGIDCAAGLSLEAFREMENYHPDMSCTIDIEDPTPSLNFSFDRGLKIRSA